MCGIAGLVAGQDQSLDASFAEAACAALVHRGPDDVGFYRDAQAHLGQRRLSIIDLAGGHQPMSNEDGTVWVTFNGENYNFRSLRQELQQRGHRFATASDTEVIVHAYEEWGTDCVSRLRGMFAFGLWDERRKLLLLARDRAGKKPVFYAQIDGQFAFASELQALLKHPGIARDVDPRALDEYLTYGYIPAPRTIFRGVSKLPPAHMLVVQPDAGEARLERYWQLEYEPKLEISEADAASALKDRLTEAVRLRMLADVPVGALLSGGLDSSVVVALMSQLSDRPVETFSIGFAEREYDELEYARAVAKRCGTRHHELIVRPDALATLPTLIRHYGEPYADSSAIPTFHLAQFTSQHVKVALTGDGGDECLAGYDRYFAGMLADSWRRVPRAARRMTAGAVAVAVRGSSQRSHVGRAHRFLTAAERPLPRRYAGWLTFFTSEQKQELYSAQLRDTLAPSAAEDWLPGLFERYAVAGIGGLDSMLAVDFESYLPYDLLVKTDIATMANSLEARSPFLDQDVLEFCARLPASFKLRGRSGKYLLRKVAAELLPPEILTRRKMGFGVPMRAWLRAELRPLLDEVLLSERALGRGYFQPRFIRRLVAEHAAGSHDHAYQLWALLCLELWHCEFID